MLFFFISLLLYFFSTTSVILWVTELNKKIHKKINQSINNVTVAVSWPIRYYFSSHMPAPCPCSLVKWLSVVFTLFRGETVNTLKWWITGVKKALWSSSLLVRQWQLSLRPVKKNQWYVIYRSVPLLVPVFDYRDQKIYEQLLKVLFALLRLSWVPHHHLPE